MIEQDSIGSEHIVGFSIINNNPESIHFGCPCCQMIRVEHKDVEWVIYLIYTVYDCNFVSKKVGQLNLSYIKIRALV